MWKYYEFSNFLKKKSNTQKISQGFHNNWVDKFSLTSRFYLSWLICHINKCEIFFQIFCIYKHFKNIYSMWFILISNFVFNKIIEFKQYLDFFKVIFKYIKGLNSFFTLGPSMHKAAPIARKKIVFNLFSYPHFLGIENKN